MRAEECIHIKGVTSNWTFSNIRGGGESMKNITVRRAVKVDATAWWIVF